MSLHSFWRTNWAGWAAALVILSGPAESAEKKKKPAVTESSPPAALRVWKSEFASNRSVRINRRAPGRKGAPAESIELTEGYRFADYAPVPAGSWTFEAIDPKKPGTSLASLTASLAASSFATLLIQEKQGVITVELLEDIAPKGEVAELVVRNFAPTLKFVNVDAGRDLHVRLVSQESFLVVRGLPRTRMQVETTGEETSGQTLKWSNGVNFKKIRRATLLIYPDAYGRIRPRVVADGEFMAMPEEETLETSPPPK